jgi:hypothetical protein
MSFAAPTPPSERRTPNAKPKPVLDGQRAARDRPAAYPATHGPA